MRRFPNVRVRHNVRNASSRNGVKPRIIVLHSTEGTNQRGLADLVGLGHFFNNSATQVSSHVATDAEGQSARYVSDVEKAWTQAAYNSLALSIEMIGKAAQTRWSSAQVDETARWIAHWSRHHDIPCRRGRVSGGKVTRSGVVTHKQLGAAGGSHVDPGAGFPVEACIRRAATFRRLQER